MALAHPPPHCSPLRPSEDGPDYSRLSRETKRRRFHPLRAVRNIFRRRLRRVESEEFQQSSNKSRSTTELIEPSGGNKNDDKQRLFPAAVPKAPYAVGLSVSHDSIFSPDPATISVDLAQHCADFKSELIAKIHARRGSGEEEEDVGLPHSPCTSPTTAEVLAHTLKNKACSKLTTTCSAGSLLSMGSSENDEDIFGTVSQNASRSSHPDNTSSAGGEEGSPKPLSHSAAHHKIAVRPRRNHPHHRKSQINSCVPNLPSTPEVCEVSFPGAGSILEESSNTEERDRGAVESDKLDQPAHKKSPEGKKVAREGMFSLFSSKAKKPAGQEAGESVTKGSPPSEEPFFTRLFSSRRSNKKAKKSPEQDSTKHGEEPSADRAEVPKPISLLDAKHSEGASSYICGGSYLLKSPCGGDKQEIPVKNCGDQAGGGMSRSVSYTTPQELEQLYSSQTPTRPFPQSSSYTLFPQHTVGEESVNVYKVSSTEDTDSSIRAAKTPDSAIHHQRATEVDDSEDLSMSIDSLNSLDDSGSKLAESREKLLELLNPHKPREEAGRRYESPSVKKVSKQALRSHSFKECDKQPASVPPATKKQATLPASISKEDIDFYFSKDVQRELVKEKSAKQTSDTRESPSQSKTKVTTKPASTTTTDQAIKQNEGVSLKTSQVVTPKETPVMDKPNSHHSVETPQVEKQSCRDHNEENSNQNNTINNNLDANQNNSRGAEEPKLKETKAKFTLTEGLGKRPAVEAPSPIKPALLQNFSGLPPAHRPSKLDLAPAPKDCMPNKDKIAPKLTTPTPEVPVKDGSPTSEESPVCKDRAGEESGISLVKRNQEKFRQLESQNLISAKRSSLPPKVDKEAGGGGLVKARKDSLGSCQTTPCTTPLDKPESELFSVFSKRTSKLKIEELNKLSSPTIESKPCPSKNDKPEDTKIVLDPVAKLNMFAARQKQEEAQTKMAEPAKDSSTKGNLFLRQKQEDLQTKSTIEPTKDAVIKGNMFGKQKQDVQTKGAEPTKDAVAKGNMFAKQKQEEVQTKTEPVKEPVTKEIFSRKKQEEVQTKVTEPPKDSVTKGNVFVKQKQEEVPNKGKEPTKDPVIKGSLFVKQKQEDIPSKGTEPFKEPTTRGNFIVKQKQEEVQNKVAEPLKEAATKGNLIVKQKQEEVPSKGTEPTKGNSFVKQEANSVGDKAKSTKTAEGLSQKQKDSETVAKPQRSLSLKCAAEQPAWVRLAQQRREHRENNERLVSGSSDTVITTVPNTKSSRSSKVLDMVNNFQKRQLT